ncbi:hypothetical protein BY996DRAFT_6500970 [Phakopsora pachyrhizi]|uniref:Uncharacterized protein n=1 Tax=Phakopsora pachyrhizi TaxID=170000 RepID=A0AAV0AMA9_PHAPC|nr:hypothetical protein BY996DRAFT_6500970 [Phakopsora pachyrhizi]CAH7669723.1 hypothetical protein PPACK8108_LOCUS4362 [Phakopsora pachyrhizi]
MHDSGPNFPFKRDDSYGFLLRRKPSSKSLKLMERNQRALSSSVSSDPKRSAYPVKSFYWRKQKGTDLFGVEDLSIPRTNLNHGYSSRKQNPFSLGERGVDMIGDKINQLKRNSISAASSPALPLVSTFMVPFAHHFDHKPISHMNRNALIITTGTTTTTVLFTPTAISTCMIDPTNAARVVTAAIKDT